MCCRPVVPVRLADEPFVSRRRVFELLVGDASVHVLMDALDNVTASDAYLRIGRFDLELPGHTSTQEADGLDARPSCGGMTAFSPGSMSRVARTLALSGREEHVPLELGSVVGPVGWRREERVEFQLCADDPHQEGIKYWAI